MKHFGMNSMDDSPTNNKPPPLTATRAVKKQWLFKVAETIVVNYIVEDADRFNQLMGKNKFQYIDWLLVVTFTDSLIYIISHLFIHFLTLQPTDVCNQPIDT